MYIFKILRHTHGMSARKFDKKISIKVRKYGACVQHLPIYEKNNTERLFYKIQKELFCFKEVCKHESGFCIWNRFAPQQKPFHPTIFKTLIFLFIFMAPVLERETI